MPNASRPSGEKDIGLLSGQFHQARIKLTCIYVAILAVILLLSSASIYPLFSSRLTDRFARFTVHSEFVFPVDIVPPNPQDVRNDLFNSLIIVNGLLLVAAGFASYWLAGITLRPIQDAFDRQRRFLGDASHELRTPLAILQADLENERVGLPEGSDARKQTESHLEEVGRMSLLVTDLLTLSRLDERGGTHHEMTAVDVGNIVRETVDRLRSVAQRQGIAVTTSPVPHKVEGVANKELLAHALSNVIKNAITYNTAGGTVTVIPTTEDAFAVIRVVDTGIGIAKEELDNIFDRFYRTDASRSRQTGGSGLGLAIVQSIMKQCNGSVQVESVPGNGTTVTLRVPATKPS